MFTSQALIQTMLMLPDSKDQQPSALHRQCLHALLGCVHESVQQSERDADMHAAISICGVICTQLGLQAASTESTAVAMRALVGAGAGGEAAEVAGKMGDGGDGGDGDVSSDVNANDDVGSGGEVGDGEHGGEGVAAAAVEAEKSEPESGAAAPGGILFQLKRSVNGRLTHRSNVVSGACFCSVAMHACLDLETLPILFLRRPNHSLP